jgi:death-on-curing family protein
LGRPSNAHYYEREDDLVTLAAYLWHGISSAHGYQDANKRTALLAALTFLEANGIEADINVSASEPGRFVDECYKNGDFEIPMLDKYLRSRCHWIEV